MKNKTKIEIKNQNKQKMKWNQRQIVSIFIQKKLTSNVDDQIQQKLKKFFEFSKQKFFTKRFFQIEKFECWKRKTR